MAAKRRNASTGAGAAKAAKKPAKAAKKPAKAAKKPAKAAESKGAKPAKQRKAITPVKAAKPVSPVEADAAAESAGLGVGDSVPSFALTDQHGETVSAASLVGKPFVLYFYPKDDTPGCTKEACGFRDDHGRFQAADVTVIGVSPDDTKSHARFAQKYGLGFTLLSDVDRTLVNAFGVWVKKQNYGREYMGVQRSTFLIDAAGKVRKVWRGVKVDGHAAAVLAAAQGGG